MTHQRTSWRTPVRPTERIGNARRVRERGSFAVMGAVWLLIALVVLASIDIGHLYFERRDLQRIADMASQAGVQTIDDACSLAPSTALAVASSNEANKITLSASSPSASSPPQPTSTTSDLLAVECGRWDTTAPPATPVSGTSPYFSPMGTSTAVTPLNAVWVQVARKVPYFFFGPTRTLTALSTARASQIDVFSLSSTLANINTSNSPLLNPLLSALLGGSVNLSVANYQSLASANISLANLAVALGVGSVDSLASAKPIALSTFLADLTGSVNVLQAGNGTTPGDITSLNAGLSVLSTVSAALGATVGSATINIANPNYANPLLNLGLGTAQAGATASVDLLDLLMASAEIANGSNAITVNIPSALSLPSISIPGASTTSATIASLQLQILQPPSIAVGESGIVTKNGTTAWRTQASQAEIGVYLDVSTPTITIGTGSLLGLLNLSSLVDVSLQIQGINLPIYLLVGGPSKAGLAATSCDTTESAGSYGTTTAAGSSTATMVVQPGVTQLCLSSPPSGSLSLGSDYNSSTQIFSCPAVPSNGLTLLNISAQGSLLSGLLGSLISYNSSVVAINASITNPLLNLSATPTATAPYTGSLPASVTSLNQPSGTYSFCTAPGNSANPVACGGSWNNPPANGTNATSYVTVDSNSLGSELSTTVSNLGLNGVTLTLGGISISLPTSWLQTLLGDILTPIGSWLDSILIPVLSLLGVQVGQATVHQISMSCNAPQLVY